jgi:N-methylhydantoinase A
VRVRIGADIGGTFTDVIVITDQGQFVASAKILTDNERPASAIVAGVREALAAAASDAQVTEVVHGTTLVANTLVQRRGAVTGLITNAGFADVLAIGKEGRYDLYDLDLELPEPLVPGPRRREISARVFADGTVAHEVVPAEVEEAVGELHDQGAESIAVVLLHSYRWPEQEEQVARLVRGLASGVDITTSASILPEMGEFARFSTAVANAYVRPALRDYLDDLAGSIRSDWPDATLRLVTGTGRSVPASTAATAPIRLLESGPAGGVLAAVAVARTAGARDCLAFDMGGTTAKAAFAPECKPRVASSFEVARVRRFKRGSGLPIQLPNIELIEIGAGGGSIGWFDDLGLLRVGPASAGGDPGPACYGLGGEEPTVTDANLALGRLRAESFLGGRMPLREELAIEALERLAARAGVGDAIEAAKSLLAVVDEQMAAAAQRHAVEQGLDRTQFTMVATGGAGPMHACSVARILGVRRVLVPAKAGVASANGLLHAPLGYDVVQSAPSALDELDWAAVDALLGDLAQRALAAAEGQSSTREISVDLKYRGHGAVVTVPVSADTVATRDARAIARALEAEYESRFRRVPQDVPIDVVTWRMAARTPAPSVEPIPFDPRGGALGSRAAYFEEAGGFVDTPVFHPTEAKGTGPMLIEQAETTVVVPPGARVEALPSGVISVELPAGDKP